MRINYMKKFLFFFLILIIIAVFHICASASSIQDPALWPAIDDITKTGDVYTFKVNVRAYCPRGLSGNLLVAAYDVNNKLLDVVLHNKTVSIPSFINTPLDNCDMTAFLEKTDLAQGIELKLKEKDNVIIKAFVMNFDTLTPKIPSGEITFKYNNGDSEVIANYTLKSDYTDLQLKSDTALYFYYYYYDGNWTDFNVCFSDKCQFFSEDTFYFYYYNKLPFDSDPSKKYTLENLDNEIITSRNNVGTNEIPGIKIVNYLSTLKDELTGNKYYYLSKNGFETTSITIHCNFSDLEQPQ